MRAVWFKNLVAFVCALVSIATGIPAGRGREPGGLHPVIPRTGDDAAMTTLEVPLANPIGSPQHVSAAYYYKIPVRPIYKSYPVYAPGHEPPGYQDWLKQQVPQVIWDDAGHRPPRADGGRVDKSRRDRVRRAEPVPGSQGSRYGLRRAKSPMVGERRGPVCEGRHAARLDLRSE